MCAGAMAGTDSNLLVYRSSLLGSVTNVYVPATCGVSEITIHWTGTSSELVSANNAGTAIYGGNINTPKGYTSAPSGKRFAGWLFRSTSPSN